ncbi:MAG: glycerol kinase GlpK [Nitrospinota bacterium]|nr:glycerol kinase GlpK [Nitrospinota bacterium]
MPDYILAIDQGTTSSRAILFDGYANLVSQDQKEFMQYFPRDGWVEHDPEEIWNTTLEVCWKALSTKSVKAKDITAIGITNQRETTVIWERKTGKPIHKAIVWQDRRTAEICRKLVEGGHEETIRAKAGLVVDPYFSATKIAWILDNVPGARKRADAGELAFGTIDTFLLWRLTGGKSHATDATNAARTSLFNIHTQEWDGELLKIFNVPEKLLPDVLDNAADFGTTDASLLGAEIPIGGMAGDQQAALFGQCCFEPGMVKSTYGTGCFMIINTGEKGVASKNRLLTTVGYRLDGKVVYAMEGSIFNAGTTVQWMRDKMKLFANASETEAMARSVDGTGGVYLVPAFTGLGAPHWDPDARGAIFGLTRDSTKEHIVRAGLEAVCYQSRDLIEALVMDGAARPPVIRVDGGMVKNDWLSQFLADISGAEVDRPVITETTALGAAFLAGLQTGVYGSLDEIRDLWKSEKRFIPSMDNAKRDALYSGWLSAIKRVLL